MEPHKTSGKGRGQGRASPPLKPHPFRTTSVELFSMGPRHKSYKRITAAGNLKALISLTWIDGILTGCYNARAMSVVSGKQIILGVSGGIAAYKVAELARRLTLDGARVDVIMTAAAR